MQSTVGRKMGGSTFSGMGCTRGGSPSGTRPSGFWPRGLQRLRDEEPEYEAHFNPKIRLDSGKVVWGCECWWGPEEVVKKTLEGYIVVEVDVDEVRAEFRAMYEKEEEEE